MIQVIDHCISIDGMVSRLKESREYEALVGFFELAFASNNRISGIWEKQLLDESSGSFLRFFDLDMLELSESTLSKEAKEYLKEKIENMMNGRTLFALMTRKITKIL